MPPGSDPAGHAPNTRRAKATTLGARARAHTSATHDSASAGQTLAVLSVGAAYGPVRGGASMILYAAAGVAGIPWFADGQSGWGGPSFGYVLGFIVSAIVVSWVALVEVLR